MPLPHPLPLSNEEREHVDRAFRGADAEEAVRRLEVRCGGRIPLMGRTEDGQRHWIARIRRAVIAISQGELGRLDEAVQLARSDGRDVLVWASHLDATG